VISQKTAREVRAMMELTIGPQGTAPRARTPGFRVAGKTSTAHKPVNGKYTNKDVSSIVGCAGFRPTHHRRGHGGRTELRRVVGGKVAAPVFAAGMQNASRALNVAPDSEVADIITPTA
jgi:cell division protein FtsI (penicillin-binding protein 3)